MSQANPPHLVPPPRRRPRRILFGVALSVMVAFALTALLHTLLAAPEYHIDATRLALTQADVGSQFTLVDEGAAPLAQRSLNLLPYQRQVVSSRSREFMANSALSAEGRQQIGDWERQYSYPVTNPPAIMGPFVAEHTGVFEISSRALSFRTEDAARQEYHCCHYEDRDLNFDDYRTFPVHLGDEADGWTGISKSITTVGSSAPQMPTDPAYQERTWVIHWRHGPVVAEVTLWGAHDIALADALHLAGIVDARITLALQAHASAKGGLHAQAVMARSSAGSGALRVADHRAYRDLHWN